jgi:nucleotide-binding universal stress UspA family protein
MIDAQLASDRPIPSEPRHDSAVPTSTHPTFQHILVPLDRSPLAERSLPYLLAVARAGAARLTLLQVLREPNARNGSVGVDVVEWEMTRSDGQSYLDAIASRLRAHGVESRLELAQGATAEQIESFATRGDVDLIVMTSHGEGGVSSIWTRGSTAQKVIAAATTSILVVPMHANAGASQNDVQLRRILLPLDCSRRAECVLPVATALARIHDADLVLAHVVCEPEMPRRMGPSPADIELAHDVVQRNRHEAASYMRELQSRLASECSRIETRLCFGTKRAQALRELAERESIDLVILAAHGGTGDAHQRYGSLAAEFLQAGYGPLLIVQDLARLAERQECNDMASTGEPSDRA